MEKIALPQKISVLPGSQPYEALITIGPFFPGYGTTLGNALRRVLLSSLPGAAVIGVKIAGADHEFMGLPGVAEDVLTIILNLKKLRLRVFSEEVCKLSLEASGKKVVTAADITPNSQVEIINPELVLANLTSKDANLSMEIFVSRGRGYEMVENRPKVKRDIGYIEVDSIYTPVVAAGLAVENVRVGQMVNWDKLVLRIVTDGTITSRQALIDASKILIDQFTAITDLAEAEPELEGELAVNPSENNSKTKATAKKSSKSVAAKSKTTKKSKAK
ncbi:DNA-directed RNA polymerase subunit alpha [Patescibacteria group bacterium]|nr:DNA-directed RNA polymerase subunit alpha [Patescibacteria group bacterium]